MFTTAPADMDDGSWTYKWDTGLIMGDLRPGTYTVHVVSSPVDHLRFTRVEYAKADVEILQVTVTGQMGPLPLLPVNSADADSLFLPLPSNGQPAAEKGIKEVKYVISASGF